MCSQRFAIGGLGRVEGVCNVFHVHQSKCVHSVFFVCSVLCSECSAECKCSDRFSGGSESEFLWNGVYEEDAGASVGTFRCECMGFNATIAGGT